MNLVEKLWYVFCPLFTLASCQSAAEQSDFHLYKETKKGHL